MTSELSDGADRTGNLKRNKRTDEDRTGACNVRTVCGAGAMDELVKGMDKCRVDVCAVQGISWPGKGTVIGRNCMIARLYDCI